MDLPTYTNIWRIEKRLYKLYDFRLPQPLPVVTLGVFLGVCAVWVALMSLIGVPFVTPWHVIWLVPPFIITFFATRPVIEGKRLTELLLSYGRYFTEARVYTRLAPEHEQAEIRVTVRVWHRDPAAGPLPAVGRASAQRRGRPRSADTEAARTAVPAEGPEPLRLDPVGNGAPPLLWAATETLDPLPAPRVDPESANAGHAPEPAGPGTSAPGASTPAGNGAPAARETDGERPMAPAARAPGPAESGANEPHGRREGEGFAEPAAPAVPPAGPAPETTQTAEPSAPAAAASAHPARGSASAAERAAFAARSEAGGDGRRPGREQGERDSGAGVAERAAFATRSEAGGDDRRPGREQGERGVGIKVLNYFGWALPKEDRRRPERTPTPSSGLPAAERTELATAKHKDDAPSPLASGRRDRGFAAGPLPGAADTGRERAWFSELGASSGETPYPLASKGSADHGRFAPYGTADDPHPVHGRSALTPPHGTAGSPESSAPQWHTEAAAPQGDTEAVTQAPASGDAAARRRAEEMMSAPLPPTGDDGRSATAHRPGSPSSGQAGPEPGHAPPPEQGRTPWAETRTAASAPRSHPATDHPDRASGEAAHRAGETAPGSDDAAREYGGAVHGSGDAAPSSDDDPRAHAAAARPERGPNRRLRARVQGIEAVRRVQRRRSAFNEPTQPLRASEIAPAVDGRVPRGVPGRADEGRGPEHTMAAGAPHDQRGREPAGPQWSPHAPSAEHPEHAQEPGAQERLRERVLPPEPVERGHGLGAPASPAGPAVPQDDPDSLRAQRRRRRPHAAPWDLPVPLADTGTASTPSTGWDDRHDAGAPDRPASVGSTGAASTPSTGWDDRHDAGAPDRPASAGAADSTGTPGAEQTAATSGSTTPRAGGTPPASPSRPTDTPAAPPRTASASPDQAAEPPASPRGPAKPPLQLDHGTGEHESMSEVLRVFSAPAGTSPATPRRSAADSRTSTDRDGGEAAAASQAAPATGGPSAEPESAASGTTSPSPSAADTTETRPAPGSVPGEREATAATGSGALSADDRTAADSGTDAARRPPERAPASGGAGAGQRSSAHEGQWGARQDGRDGAGPARTHGPGYDDSIEYVRVVPAPKRPATTADGGPAPSGAPADPRPAPGAAGPAATRGSDAVDSGGHLDPASPADPVLHPRTPAGPENAAAPQPEAGSPTAARDHTPRTDASAGAGTAEPAPHASEPGARRADTARRDQGTAPAAAPHSPATSTSPTTSTQGTDPADGRTHGPATPFGTSAPRAEAPAEAQEQRAEDAPRGAAYGPTAEPTPASRSGLRGDTREDRGEAEPHATAYRAATEAGGSVPGGFPPPVASARDTSAPERTGATVPDSGTASGSGPSARDPRPEKEAQAGPAPVGEREEAHGHGADPRSGREHAADAPSAASGNSEPGSRDTRSQRSGDPAAPAADVPDAPTSRAADPQEQTGTPSARDERLDVLDRYLSHTDTPAPPPPRFAQAGGSGPRRQGGWFTDAAPARGGSRTPGAPAPGGAPERAHGGGPSQHGEAPPAAAEGVADRTDAARRPDGPAQAGAAGTQDGPASREASDDHGRSASPAGTRPPARSGPQGFAGDTAAERPSAAGTGGEDTPARHDAGRSGATASAEPDNAARTRPSPGETADVRSPGSAAEDADGAGAAGSRVADAPERQDSDRPDASARDAVARTHDHRASGDGASRDAETASADGRPRESADGVRPAPDAPATPAASAAEEATDAGPQSVTQRKPALELDHGTGEHESFSDVDSPRRRTTAADLEAAEAAAIRARLNRPAPRSATRPSATPPASAPPSSTPPADAAPAASATGGGRGATGSRADTRTPAPHPGREAGEDDPERSTRLARTMRANPADGHSAPGSARTGADGSPAPARAEQHAPSGDDGVFSRVAQNARRLSHLFGQNPTDTPHASPDADRDPASAGPAGGPVDPDPDPGKPSLQLDHGTGEQQRLTDTPGGTPAMRRAAPPPAHTADTPGSGGTRGWRRLARVVTGGSAAPAKSDLPAGDLERLRAPLGGARSVVVLGCTGGAGQTITTLMLGHTLAAHRDHRVVAVDVNPSTSGLSRRVRVETPETLTSLLANADSVSGYLGMRRYTSQSGTGLEVVSTLDDPYVQTLDDRDYAGLTGLLEGFYEVALLDPAATGVARALPVVDGLVLVAPASEDAARSVAMTFEWLDGHGYASLRAKAIVVINGVSKRSLADVDEAEKVARGRCRAIVRVPWDDHLSAGKVVDVDALRATTRRAHAALGGVLVHGLAGGVGAGPAAPGAGTGNGSEARR
ncbi:TcpE family conjugal transfer membrane protein [Nocardiopsis mangrovi]|uniref:TcpE family conjugal transfer membrane protein n=2 Tax=Nocardiopsis TaxID=2013 RepID=A0ABV9DQ04_9ACTN